MARASTKILAQKELFDDRLVARLVAEDTRRMNKLRQQRWWPSVIVRTHDMNRPPLRLLGSVLSRAGFIDRMTIAMYRSPQAPFAMGQSALVRYASASNVITCCEELNGVEFGGSQLEIEMNTGQDFGWDPDVWLKRRDATVIIENMIVVRNLPRQVNPYEFVNLAYKITPSCKVFVQWSAEPEEMTKSAIIRFDDSSDLLRGLRAFNHISIGGLPVFAEPLSALGA